jgi:hypothetical protein
VGKFIDTASVDLALNDIKINGNKQVVCSAFPTTYLEANSTFKLAEVAMAPGDFTLGNGAVSGRRILVAAKNGVPVSIGGTANHVAILDTVNLRIKLATDAPSQAVSAGAGTVNVAGWDHEIRAPA